MNKGNQFVYFAGSTLERHEYHYFSRASKPLLAPRSRPKPPCSKLEIDEQDSGITLLDWGDYSFVSSVHYSLILVGLKSLLRITMWRFH